jgi:D-inositol-3-phosphate glycosyltransferase
MNIAMISYHTCPLATLGGKDTGGMNVYVRELTRALGHIGVHVDVFTRSQDEHVPHVLHDLGYGNRVVHIPAGPEVPLPKQELASYIPEFSRGMLKFAADKGIHYDLVHSHYWMSGVAAKELKKQWQVPVAHMFHTLVLMKNRVAQSVAEIEGSYRLEGETECLAIADRIIVATPAEEAQLNFLYNVNSSKLDIIPPGVDTGRFYPIPADEARDYIGIPTCDCMILFVGRIEPLKGLDTLVRAVARLRDQGSITRCPHYLAVIGGDPEAKLEDMTTEMRRIQELCCQLGLDEMVVFLGKRDQEVLPYYYSAAQVLVMPSLYESFGMVALEAMACGTPVVASQVGGLAFLVKDGETGYVIPDGDPDLLAERLALLINDEELRKQMGKQATEYASKFAWSIIAERIKILYGEMLAGQPAISR